MLVNEKKRSRNSHRGRLDIVADILNASFGGARKTHLMYRCNLSFKQLKYYLELLLRIGLLHFADPSEGHNPSFFAITDKGREFLEAYKGLKGLMN
ncbi:hypothetical protein KAT21_03740 [Candidatus Bathyarchaeota archaeon]|nr:hypothetical protein [Candidatus Bathyarchaeota archaeon]